MMIFISGPSVSENRSCKLLLLLLLQSLFKSVENKTGLKAELARSETV